jgi:hypothetical protein
LCLALSDIVPHLQKSSVNGTPTLTLPAPLGIYGFFAVPGVMPRLSRDSSVISSKVAGLKASAVLNL